MPELKLALAALLLLALSEKQKLILAYVADYGTAGLLDYAETVLDAGWDAHFTKASALLSEAAVDSTMEVLDASGIKYTEEFVNNLEKHTELIANNEAASLLGLSYDIAHDVAVPTVAGWLPAEEAITQLGEAITETETSAGIEKTIEDMSLFSGKRAEQYALNAITYVSGASARASAAATGATHKRSETVGDDRVCDDCDKNEADGWIGINDAFSGSDTIDTPHHPNCRCSCEYEWAENMRSQPLEEAA